MIGARVAAAALALAAVGARAEPAAPVPEGPLSLELLMRHMAETPGVVASFTETKELELLDVPIVSEGTLYFIPPDRMARVTTSPGRSRMVIDGNRLSFGDETGESGLAIGDHPVARTIIGNFIVLFNGDLAELRERYAVGFEREGEGDETRWRLELTPRSAPLSDFVRSITMRGDGQALTEMLLVETEGDRTRTAFHDVEVDHRFSEEELSRIFGPSSRD